MTLHHIINRSFTALLFLCSCLCAGAQNNEVEAEAKQSRPVLSAWSIGVGSSHLADTYLSPLKYEGWSGAISYTRMQAVSWQSNEWITILKLSADIDRTENPARNATMWNAQIHASWGAMKRWRLPHGISLAIGPSIRAEGGCLYSARNSNNPASAKGAVTIDAIGMASWNTHILKVPVTLFYQPSMPVIGAFFSPKYDELYYEIYLGNHGGLVHPAWWGNRFKIDNLIAADLHLGSTSLRVGYEMNWMSSNVSNLTTRMIYHRFVLGVTCEWLSFNRYKSGTMTRSVINSALY